MALTTNNRGGEAVQIQTYQFGDAERLRFGKYPLLDTVLSRWARGIEEAVFTHLRVEVYVGASVVEEMRFAEFFRSLKHARPVYLFTCEPFPGQGMFVLDNRFANACLHGTDAGEGEGQDKLQVTEGNQDRLQRVTQALMERFDAAWDGIEPVHTHLEKVTTYLFRARMYHAYEQCLVAQLHLSGDKLSARLMVCVPKFMLAPAIERAARHPVIPAVAPAALPNEATVQGVLGTVAYDVTASVGTVTLALNPETFRVGQVLSLSRPAEGDIVLEVNGTPALVGEVGDSAGRYAVRVTGTFRDTAKKAPEPAPFKPLTWPKA